MLSEVEISKEVMRLQSEVASYDIILNRRTTSENPQLVTDLTHRRERCLTLIHTLEWVLEREPSL